MRIIKAKEYQFIGVTNEKLVFMRKESNNDVELTLCSHAKVVGDNDVVYILKCSKEDSESVITMELSYRSFKVLGFDEHTRVQEHNLTFHGTKARVCMPYGYKQSLVVFDKPGNSPKCLEESVRSDE